MRQACTLLLLISITSVTLADDSMAADGKCDATGGDCEVLTKPKKKSKWASREYCTPGVKCASDYRIDGAFRIYDESEVSHILHDVPVRTAQIEPAGVCCATKVDIVIATDGMPLMAAADNYLCPEYMEKFRHDALHRESWTTTKEIRAGAARSRAALRDGKKDSPAMPGRASRLEPKWDQQEGSKNDDYRLKELLNQCVTAVTKAVYNEVGVEDPYAISEPGNWVVQVGYEKRFGNLWDRNSTVHIDKNAIGLATVLSCTPNTTYESTGTVIVKYKGTSQHEELMRVHGIVLENTRAKRDVYDMLRGALKKMQVKAAIKKVKSKKTGRSKKLGSAWNKNNVKYTLPHAVVVGMHKYNRVLLYEETTMHATFMPPVNGPYSDELWEGRLTFNQQHSGPILSEDLCAKHKTCEACYNATCGWCLSSKRCVPDGLDEQKGCKDRMDHVGDAGDVMCNGEENEKTTKRKVNEASCAEALRDCQEDDRCNLCYKKAMEKQDGSTVSESCQAQDLWVDLEMSCSGQEKHDFDAETFVEDTSEPAQNNE